MGKLKEKLLSADSTVAEPTDSVDRIILKRDTRDKLDRWLQQLTDKYDGMIKHSKSDLANFLIREHAESLSELEVRLVGAEYYDEMRWINRAIEKVRQAKRSGASLTLEELMEKRRPIEKMKMSLKKKDISKRDQDANDEVYIENQIANSDSEIPKS